MSDKSDCIPPFLRPMMTQRAFAEYFNVSIDTVRAWRKNGIIRSVKVGGRCGSVRIPRTEIERLLKERAECAAKS